MTERRDVLNTRYMADAAKRFAHAKAEAIASLLVLKERLRTLSRSIPDMLKELLPEKFGCLPIRPRGNESSFDLVLGIEFKADEWYNVSCPDGNRIRVTYGFSASKYATRNDIVCQAACGGFGNNTEAKKIEDALQHPRCDDLKWALTGLALLTDVARCGNAIKLE